MRAPSATIAVTAAALIASAAFAARAGPATPALEPLWTLEGLSSPESLTPTADGRAFYVSNVNGEGGEKDGNGFIALVSHDGKLMEERWAEGLDAPKGLALKDGRLYVADIHRLVVIDATSGVTMASHDAPDAAFLNDVAVLPDGRVLVADSGKQRIYVLDGQSMKPWLEDPLLRSINGLLSQGGRLVVTTMQGRLLSIDPATKAITTLAEGLGEGDGVARLADGTWLVSEWPGRLFHVRADGSNVVVADTREREQFWNDFLLVGDTLVVPNWKPGTLSAYRVTR